jgi:hypothetical protein
MHEALTTLLVGEEGCRQGKNKDWLRPATEEERDAFMRRFCLTEFAFNALCFDHLGRPYCLKTLLKNAPPRAREKARNYVRAVTLTY